VEEPKTTIVLLIFLFYLLMVYYSECKGREKKERVQYLKISVLAEDKPQRLIKLD